jgi:hypothetical protein
MKGMWRRTVGAFHEGVELRATTKVGVGIRVGMLDEKAWWNEINRRKQCRGQKEAW